MTTESKQSSGAEDTRTERDSMGELQVPVNALWGAQTQRAVNNFPISGLAMPRAFIRALGLIKGAAAVVNRKLGLLENDEENQFLAGSWGGFAFFVRFLNKWKSRARRTRK